jgi:hypothetical protein
MKNTSHKNQKIATRGPFSIADIQQIISQEIAIFHVFDSTSVTFATEIHHEWCKKKKLAPEL